MKIGVSIVVTTSSGIIRAEIPVIIVPTVKATASVRPPVTTMTTAAAQDGATTVEGAIRHIVTIGGATVRRVMTR